MAVQGRLEQSDIVGTTVIDSAFSLRLKQSLKLHVQQAALTNKLLVKSVTDEVLPDELLQYQNKSTQKNDTKSTISGTLFNRHVDSGDYIPSRPSVASPSSVVNTLVSAPSLTKSTDTKRASDNVAEQTVFVNSHINQQARGAPMQDLSGYKDLSKPPVIVDEPESGSSSSTASLSSVSSAVLEQTPVFSPEFVDSQPNIDTEFSSNVRTLIRLVNDLPEGVTKQTGAQIIRLTMEAMGISMEEVLTEAQSAQSEMLDAVRANIKKIEEYKTVIRKLESDIKYYQGKANELSEIIDLFILSNTSPKLPNVDEVSHG